MSGAITPWPDHISQLFTRIDCQQRDELAHINRGLELARRHLRAAQTGAPMYPPIEDDVPALQEVVYAAVFWRNELRDRVAMACAPWFEVRQ